MTGKQRNIRKRRALDEQEELSDGEGAAAPGGEGAGEPAAPRLTAEDIKALQKQRQRRTGIDATLLMAAEARERRADAAVVAAGEVPEDGLQAAFKRERRLHSEEDDPHMKKYVEEQLAKRMGRSDGQEEAARAAEAAARAADPILAALPEGLRKREQNGELDPSWVAGITEVPLSMEQKLKNIEDTEAAKNAMLGGDDDSGGGPRGARRAAFPVSFGRQDPKFLKMLQESHAKKARMRERQEEKKEKKKQEFAGW
ncbi:hypothetical protein C2E20_1228 [Micractinium conductrix]|uniref:Uncharacterized protein n=1 Tax=Micractinium conductrix TaxID=554055 RepID=A0A2P6VP55_9CHLO|nr:hypothetical protein C2E20_1228 [Micractinium conductrix]|eukprot:PSC75860.1 hypothetical protein C2E20_1228 [Micractinium conductrix]